MCVYNNKHANKIYDFTAYYLQVFLCMHEGQEKMVNVEVCNLAKVALFRLPAYLIAFVVAAAVMRVILYALNF